MPHTTTPDDASTDPDDAVATRAADGVTLAAALARAVRADPAKVAEIATSLHRSVRDEDALADLLDRAAAAAVRWLPDVDFAGITVQFDRTPFTAADTDPRVLVIDALQQALGDGPCIQAQDTGVIVAASGAQARARWPALASGARQQGVHSFLASPLVVDGVGRGSINMYSRDEDGFPEGESDLVAVLGEYVSRSLAEYTAVRSAATQVAQLREAMVGRAPIEQAKGILMAVHQVDADRAFEMLRTRSQNTNTRLRDVAVAFVAHHARPVRTAGGPTATPGAAGGAAPDFQSAFDHAPHGLALADTRGVLATVNPALARLVDGDAAVPARFEGTPLGAVVHPDDVPDLAEGLAELHDQRRTTRTVVVRMRSPGDEWVVAQVDAAVVLDGAARPAHLVVHVQDVTEQHAQAEALRAQALHDPLTGLPNRALLLERLRHGAVRHARSATPLTVLYLDVDDFKGVNDTLGHHGGDVVLQVIAERLGSGLRPGDTAARLGGDEFAVILEDTDTATATTVVEQVRRDLAAPIEVHATTLVVRVSIGAATAEPPGAPVADELLRGADNAMYRDKRA